MYSEDNHWRRILSKVLRENIVQYPQIWLILSYHQGPLVEKYKP